MSVIRRLTVLHGAFYLSLALIGFTLVSSTGEQTLLNLMPLDITHSTLHLGMGSALIALGLTLTTSVSSANRVMSAIFGVMALMMLIMPGLHFDMPTAAMYLISAVICGHMGFIAHWEPAPLA